MVSVLCRGKGVLDDVVSSVNSQIETISRAENAEITL